MVELTIDERPVTVPEGITIYEAARRNGIRIPVLCHMESERPVGVCRVCSVEAGERTLSAACVRPVENGMKVVTNSPKVEKARKTLIELLMADHPSPCARHQLTDDCELEVLARANGVKESRYPKRPASRGPDDSSTVISVDHDACILCDRCIRGCNEIRANFVLGRTGKGFHASISFDLNDPMGNSSCVSCGECMVSCPTGALTNKRVVDTTLGDPLDAQFLKAMPFFRDVSGTFLDLNKNAVAVREFKAGEVICHEGEYGSSAFFIIKGKAQMHLRALQATDRKPATSSPSRFGRMFGRRKPIQNEPTEPTARIIDLGPTDFIGEVACMNMYPRTATVKAVTDCVMLEMLRNVLDILQRNRELRAKTEAKYRSRELDQQLRYTPILASVTADFIETLRDRVDLVRKRRGEIIYRQGDSADGFYLIRIGFVKISEAHEGGDLVLAYEGAGGCFGEVALLGDNRRDTTTTALDTVDLVKIHAEDFHEMLARFPDVRRNIETLASQRQRAHLSLKPAAPLSSFLEQGLMEANSLLILDLEKCTRCDNCVRACADAHDGVTRLVREGLRFDKHLVATSCRHCRDPLCMVGCPVGSIRRRNTLEMVIEDWCIGCGHCANNCPYGNISLHSYMKMEPDPDGRDRLVPVMKERATSCDLCADLAEPSCVYACPHDAAHRVDPNEYFRGLLR